MEIGVNVDAPPTALIYIVCARWRVHPSSMRFFYNGMNIGLYTTETPREKGMEYGDLIVTMQSMQGD